MLKWLVVFALVCIVFSAVLPRLARFGIGRIPGDIRFRVRGTEVSIPLSLAKFAADAGLTMRQTLVLLDMQKQIVAHRSARKKDGLEAVDWQKFYEGVKEFLENE